MLRLGLLIGILSFCLCVSAQGHLSQFLADNKFTAFKLNSSLKTVETDRKLKDNLKFRDRVDNYNYYTLEDMNINLLGLTIIKTGHLTFQNNLLQSVELEYLSESKSDNQFDKVYNAICIRYGKPNKSIIKFSSFSKYIWNDENNDLLLKASKESFLLIYRRKAFENKGWIYNDRKGRGQGEIKPSLTSWENLINKHLTIKGLESELPAWKSCGKDNHIQYYPNRNSKVFNIPKLSINYKLNDCELTITTVDTSTRVIEDYKFSNFKYKKVPVDIKRNLVKQGYILDTSTGLLYTNKQKNIAISIMENKQGDSFTIFK